MSDGEIRLPFEGGTSFLLTTCGSEVRRRWARMLADHGLTPHHFALLQVLEHLGEASQKEVSAAIGIDPRNAPPLLDLLDERDLITRADSQLDRRRQVIRLTPLGSSIVGSLQDKEAEVEEEYLAPLSSTERIALRALLLRLSNKGQSGVAPEEQAKRPVLSRAAARRAELGNHPFLH